MAKKTINLNYSKNDLSFFSDITKIKKAIKEFKGHTALAEFTEAHEFEIGRGKSYAVFPELQTDVDEGRKVTIESFRNSLTKRGVSDIEYQNKVLCMILQNKAGIQYPLGSIINNLLLGNGHQLLMNSQYDISLKVNSKNDVTLVFKAIWEDFSKDPREPAISVCASVNITPGMVAITDFNITQISDSRVTTDAFKFLEDNQQNIVEKIVSYIKRVFGFNSELRLEKSSDEDVSWSPNP